MTIIDKIQTEWHFENRITGQEIRIRVEVGVRQKKIVAKILPLYY
jgi:hypothetical protein